MPIDRAIERTIASMRYSIQHVVYEEAAEAAKAMIGADHDDWAQRWAVTPQAEFLFVFQATGLAPVTRGVVMPRENMGIYGVTKRRVEELKRVFIANCEVYGCEPWLDIQPVRYLDDSELPVWA